MIHNYDPDYGDGTDTRTNRYAQSGQANAGQSAFGRGVGASAGQPNNWNGYQHEPKSARVVRIKGETLAKAQRLVSIFKARLAETARNQRVTEDILAPMRRNLRSQLTAMRREMDYKIAHMR